MFAKPHFASTRTWRNHFELRNDWCSKRSRLISAMSTSAPTQQSIRRSSTLRLFNRLERRHPCLPSPKPKEGRPVWRPSSFALSIVFQFALFVFVRVVSCSFVSFRGYSLKSITTKQHEITRKKRLTGKHQEARQIKLTRSRTFRSFVRRSKVWKNCGRSSLLSIRKMLSSIETYLDQIEDALKLGEATEQTHRLAAHRAASAAKPIGST